MVLVSVKHTPELRREFQPVLRLRKYRIGKTVEITTDAAAIRKED
jgi:hypothetical protein